jgi:AraC-like DNA-binding protein
MLHGWIFDNNPGNVIEDICLLFRKNLFKELSVTLPEIGPLGHLDSRQHTAFQLRGDLLKNVRHEMQEIIKTDSLGQLSGVIRILGHLALSDEMNPTGINRPLKKRDKKIQQIEIYVSLHYNHDIPIDEIASLVHMNRSSFCVFFKRMKGVSFTNYLNTYRMDIACRLLSTTDKSVSEIAYGVGFNNLSHFCRTFLKYKEVSPTKYRNRMGHGHSDITTTPA